MALSIGYTYAQTRRTIDFALNPALNEVSVFADDFFYVNLPCDKCSPFDFRWWTFGI